MFPYNESEWDFISSAKTLQGEIKLLRRLRLTLKMPVRKKSHGLLRLFSQG
jgi:hypothetical protein